MAENNIKSGSQVDQTEGSLSMSSGASTAAAVGASPDVGAGAGEQVDQTLMNKLNSIYSKGMEDLRKTYSGGDSNRLHMKVVSSDNMIERWMSHFMPTVMLLINVAFQHGRTDVEAVTAQLKTCVQESVKEAVKDEVDKAKADITAATNEAKTELQNEAKKIKDDMLSEVATAVDQRVAGSPDIQNMFTGKLVKCRSDIDKQEAYDRGNNIIFSGLRLDASEKTSRTKTTEIIIEELSKINCDITKDDLLCHRIYRRNASESNLPPLVVARFVSQIVRNKVMSYRQTFTKPDEGKYMNEDMTALQRSLFNYLRTKEDIVIKKTVGYKDGKIVFLLKKNEHIQSNKKWSYAQSVLDLGKIDPGLEVNLLDADVMKSLGLKECMWTTNLE